MAGISYGASAGKFFKDYREYLGGYYNDFKTLPSLGIGTKIFLSDKVRLAASVSYIYSYLNESYDQPYLSNRGMESRYISQKIDIKSIPVFLSVEYFPYVEQFKSYIGAGAGLCYTDIIWKEKIFSTNDTDKRKGGLHIADESVNPSIVLFAAVDLGFDKRSEESFLGSFIIETKFIYIFREYQMFREVSSQLDENNKNVEYGSYYTIIPYYISLSIGVSFNFSRKI